MITYLLGAGASANCVPTVDKFRDDFKLLSSCTIKNIEQLFDPGRERMDSIKATAGNYQSVIEPHPTIDILAKKLFLKRELSDLNHLKKWLIVFFNVVQYARPIDERYIKFFASLIEPTKQSLPSHINIITWNYDFQLELAFSGFSRSGDQALDLIHEDLGMFPYSNFISDYRLEDDGVNDKFTVTRLNGSSLMFTLDNHQFKPFFMPSLVSARRMFTEDSSERLSIDLKIFQAIDLYLKQYEDFERNNKLNKYYQEFTYCWEQNNIARIALQRAIKIAERTTELYIIGYSFPFVNRLFDDAIFKKMQKLERIIIQDPFMDQASYNYIKARLEKIVTVGSRPIVEHNDFTKEFILPE